MKQATGSFLAVLPLLCLLACATSGSAPAPPDTRLEPRFANPEAIVVADSAEGNPIPGSGHIRYPDAERSQDVEAALVVVFVLDTLGAPEYRTISFLGSATRPFVTEVYRWLRVERFTPVRRDGGLRRALIITPLTFTLQIPDAQRRQPQPKGIDVSPSRRLFAAQGMLATAQRLDSMMHCD